MNINRRKLLKLSSLSSLCFSIPSWAKWDVKASLPIRVQEIYPTVHKGQIYVAGGLSPDTTESSGVSDKVWRYRPDQDKWMEAVSLPEPRHHPHLISTGESLYAFSGFVIGNGGRWFASRDVLMLDEKAKHWKKIAEMPFPMCETVATVINQKVHLAGGRRPFSLNNGEWQHHDDINEHLIFDPSTKEWAKGPPLPTARNSAAGVLLNNRWYIVGGRTVRNGNLAVNEVYDASTNQWSSLKPMPQTQGGLAAAALGDSIVVFGGEYFDNGGGVYKEVWQYLPGTDEWKHLTDMPVPRHGLGAVTLANEIYVVAGATHAGAKGTSDRLSVYKL